VNLPPLKVCRRIRQLFAMLGSPNASEAENARDKLTKLLAKHGLRWNDLSAILAATEPATTRASPSQPTEPPQVNVLDLVLRLLELHLALIPEQRMAMALWTLHSHVFRHYPVRKSRIVKPVDIAHEQRFRTIQARPMDLPARPVAG
jgi:Protein of unknown function (DUF2786)